MKPLRYIIAVSVTMFMVSSVFAERSLEFEATPQNVGLYDMIDARILLSSDENTSVNAVSIGGIDNFSVISQGKSTSVQIINGDMQQKTEFQLKLQAKKQGDFVLGPVIIGEGTGAVSASGVTIHVTDIPVAMSSTTST
ncbi:MAG: BatD family protein [Candidatus Peribacteria bacterium]|nr:MAG: BatD family protein [Candidatus Peribacteria bacterium]